MHKKQNLNEISSRVSELLARMTLEEKIAQLGSCWMYEIQTLGVLDSAKVEARLANGIGQITRLGGSSIYTPQEVAEVGNQLQRHLREKTRLGIPAILHEECCVGLVAPCNSVFPQIIGLASTFQPELARQMTDSIRSEMLAVGARQGLAPVLDVARDPRWGRIEETFGEDPTLVSQFGVEYIRGLQGDDLREGVLATAKHFIGHSFSLGGMNCAPVHLGWRELFDVYMGPFEAAIRDAGLATMMNAYPQLDGEVVAASRKILTDLLREKLGFDGLVVSDYEAVVMIHNYHWAAQTRKEAAIKALTAGIDVELPSTACYGEDLVDALQSGELDMEVLDLSVRRHLQKKFELGLFDNPFVDEHTVLAQIDTPASRALAYEIAAKSMVLLKNDGTLPLHPTGVTLAVIGPNADSKRCMMGDYSYTSMAELLQAVPNPDCGVNLLGADDLRRFEVPVPSVLEVLEQKHPNIKLRFARGCDIASNDESGIAEAVAAAQESDVALVFVGGISGLAPHATTGEFRDSTDLRLPGVQEKLVQAVISTGKPVVLVLLNGRPVAMPELVEPASAILEAWIPGEEGARAVVDTLFGEINPGGRLPLSVPRSAGQVPVFYNYKPSGQWSNIYGDYVNQKASALFPFGFGLSYTTFVYSDLRIAQPAAKAGETVNISLKVQNTGSRAGDEVVQLYVRDEFASFPRPVKELRGFVRLSLQPGETREVIFHLPVDQLAFHDGDLRLVVEPGTIRVMAGSSSEDIRLYGSFEISGDTVEIKDRVFVCPVEVR